MKKNKGFSLIELLIVVAIILIIAAIAIPNLLRSRIAANEASAVASLRTLNTAEVTYASTYNSGFTSTLGQLATPSSGQPSWSAADLVDPILSGQQSSSNSFTGTTFTKNGFIFAYTNPGTGSYPQIAVYAVNADPMARGSSGQRSFYSDQSAVVRANATAGATSGDNPI
jgi:prepilin-type N-terminal cleavage/methylation domain-containing protein